MVKKYIPLIIVVLVAIFASWSLLTSGFIPTHDGEYHLIRFYEFDKNIKAGIFFPRWAPGLNSGFGVPLFNFFYPLPNYIGEFFHFLGFSFIDSFKLTLAAGVIIGGLFFYLWVKEIFGVWGGVVGAVFYTLAPYHLIDVYIRGSPGEVWALALFPAILWAVEKKSYLASLLLALLVLSHNILALIFLPFLISYLIFRRFLILNSLFFILLAFSLSCYFWLPALVEAKYVTGLKIVNFADHFPMLWQLIVPSWGTGYSVPGINDGMSFQIGIPHLLAVILAIFWGRKKRLVLFFLFWLVVIVFLLLEISLPVWKIVPLMSRFQYPWRFLSLVILIVSFLAAFLTSFKKSKIIGVFLIFLALIFYGKYSRLIKYPPRSDDFYLSNPTWTDGTTTLGDSFNTIWASGKRIERAKEKLVVNQGEAEIQELSIAPTKYLFRIKATTPTTFQVNTAYFPGWKVFVDQKPASVDFNNGLINFQADKGEHLVEIKFTDTPVRSLAKGISLASLLFLVAVVILKR